MKKASRLQSAMEYLMTYGWAILIIAVVLGALFQLGVFNSSSFSPRAPPGACQVFRPSGPGTVTNINLMGVCTGQLPQYVAQFNGATGRISIPNVASLRISSSFSLSAWVKPIGTTAGYYGILAMRNVVSYTPFVADGFYFRLYTATTLFLDVFSDSNGYTSTSGVNVQSNSWSHVVGVYDSGTQLLSTYVNGALKTTQAWAYSPTASTSALCIGALDCSNNYFNGTISNAQVYNTSLSANQIQALYLEGMGGAPMKLQNLIGWWPLNGDVKDYSGNNNNGVPTAVSFTSQYGK